jgi:hypothetical protein
MLSDRKKIFALLPCAFDCSEKIVKAMVWQLGCRPFCSPNPLARLLWFFGQHARSFINESDSPLRLSLDLYPQ